MLQEYFYEIIASIIILTSVVIYFLLVKFKRQEEEHIESLAFNSLKQYKKFQELKNIPSLIENTDIKKFENDEAFILNDTVEGSFGDINTDPFKEQKIPPHGKISKENFKEFAGVKLLVAEDNLINQKIINGLLSDSGIEVTMADDGQILLDILEKNSNFDIILMDLNMPRVDGFEATRRIRANPDYEHIVVVALSGDTSADDIKKMYEAGMKEHLEKPLRMDTLYDVLYTYTKSDNQRDA